jgi:GTP-binding protein
VADYPFTTLVPNLGVVSLGTDSSFVIADIPGLIEGASDGAGLGIQFLRHVARTSLLLHLVDIAPIDGTDVAAQVRAIELELEKFNPELLERPRWLVLNKADMLAEGERTAAAEKIIGELGWTQPWFLVSAIARENTMAVCQQVQRFFESQREVSIARVEMVPGDVRLRGAAPQD